MHSLAEVAGEAPPEEALASTTGASAYIEGKLAAQPPTERQVRFTGIAQVIFMGYGFVISPVE